ncbi:carboxypeptidase-like regulatory domain-containing protein [Gemmatimonas phototrophica]|uniref:TonB-dependent receptor plug domain-containing protein n=1 Tax=Gemmatimonas phototrophica TaxID=1379270 RepID=A0A143BM61_9BACT|nr:carboxypeptidase-like regulatory domain-containing protein [Gemmatimonas phototrophica]AMW06166.1 hypothetical protein GEMMAAP_18005 [Gemmatimonas phototrophica]
MHFATVRALLAAGLMLLGGGAPAMAQLTPAGPPVSAPVRGVVYDSVARAPLAYAAVRLFQPGKVSDGIDTRTDSTGAFSVPALSAGPWLVSFLHPRLDSLRIEAPVAQVQVVEAGTITLTLAIPSAATLAKRLCGSPPEDSVAVVTGDVRDAMRRRPVVGAMVRASWPEWVFAKARMGREEVARAARTDSSGTFVLCHVPMGTTVTALASRGRDSTGVVELPVPTRAYVVADFVLDVRDAAIAGTGGEVAAAGRADSMAFSLRRGAGMVRGTVRTPDGSPFANAIARVLGSGSVVRTDSTGTFRLADAVAGTQTVEVRAVGFDARRLPVVLTPGIPLSVQVTLEKSRVMLDTVRVTAGRVLPPDVRAIERRWRRGLGTILDGATVRERTSTQLTSVLWGIPGVRLGMRAGYGNVVYVRGGGGGECIPPIYLDGFRFEANGISIDEIVPPSEVAAIEMYPRAMQRPAEFTDLGDCGVLVVWTRSFLGNVPVMDPRRRGR